MSALKNGSRCVAAVPPSAVPSSEPLLLSIPAAARVLSCTVWALRSLLWSKQIPHIKIGRRFLVRPSDLDAFIKKQVGAA